MCLSILDIDNFKQLNDTLGHKAGDMALVHLSGVVRQSIRPSDIISRYGGEEFVILLPETPLDVAVQVMTRVQRELTRKFFLQQQRARADHLQRRRGATTDGRNAGRRAGPRRSRAVPAKHSGKNRVAAE